MAWARSFPRCDPGKKWADCQKQSKDQPDWPEELVISHVLHEQLSIRNALGAMVIKEKIMMRIILIVGLAAAGLGLAGTSGASAVPVNGAVIDDLATATDHGTPVQWGHWRWGSRGYHWRWGSYGGHWRWGSRGYIGVGAAGDGGGGKLPNLRLADGRSVQVPD
jgi:hypothetical protein